MSNLGSYQIITTLSKKVGGPLNLALIFGATCFTVGMIVNAQLSTSNLNKALLNDNSEEKSS